MKTLFLVILGLFFVNGSNNFVKCCGSSTNFQTKCVLCDETPCQCEEPASEDNNYKISIKKIILSFLKKVNYRSSESSNQDSKFCRNTCPKKHGVAKLLANILRKACTSEKEEESIAEIIEKLLDPAECEKKPCQAHCDPQVQEVLRAILRKASGCDCEDCPSNCIMNPPRCGQEEYKYWFKTTKEAMRKEISDKYTPRPNRPKCPPKEDAEQTTSCRDVKIQKKYNKNKVYECASEKCKKCKKCQRPDSLICPRYVTEDCPIRRKADLFSICADCHDCRIIPSNKNSYPVLSCKGCKAVDSPFVQFTINGYPFKQDAERQSEIRVRTKFLQINDFRLDGETKSVSAVYNPFKPKSDGPRKKRGRECNKKKSKWI